MKTSKSAKSKKKKYFTIAEANATLPLLRAILRDITELARDLHEKHQRLSRLQNAGKLTEPHTEELQTTVASFERDQERMQELEGELRGLHVELKDYFTGLVDFPCWMNDHEVYLCWRLDEAEVAHWHEIDSGFAGRQKI